MRIKTAQRMLWLCVIMLIVMGALTYRVFDLQILQEAELTRQVFSQRTDSLPLQMRRGRILDRNGVDLTDPHSGYGLAAFPRLMGDPEATAWALVPVLGEEAATRVLAYSRANYQAAWVVEGLEADEAEQVEALDLPGIAVGPTGFRYGSESLARHLVGYANAEGGQTGLELVFEEALRGGNVPHLTATYDGRGRPLHEEGIRVVQPRDPSDKEPFDLHTTIDARIQAAVEEAMDQVGHPVSGPLRAAAVVMDVKTGEPLAIASRPNFKQTVLPTESQLRNRALTPYETGSVFKPIVAAAALEKGEVSMDEVFECGGVYQLGDTQFHDVEGTPHAQVTFAEAIAQSCNIPFIEVGYERLGGEALLEAARRFGFGSTTGALPEAYEPSGHLPELKYGGDVAQFSFGQGGLMATPLQVARAYVAIANGGVLHPARLVTAIRKPSGEVVSRPHAEEPRRVMSTATARQLQSALLMATHPDGQGTGRSAWVEGVGAAGKSGSADTVMDGNPATHAWFAGWFPVEQPRYVVVVMIEDGKAGGTFAAPLFQRIAQGILAL